MSQEELDRRMLENFLAGMRNDVYEPTLEEYFAKLAATAEEFSLPEAPIEPIHDAACQAVMVVYANRWMHRTGIAQCESPLERVLALALHVEAERRCDDAVLWASCRSDVHEEEAPRAPSQVSICHQHRVGIYRVDILVTGYLLDWQKRAIARRTLVAVEVDGHDFHERTKEQAEHDKAKDRELQRCGLTVFRFTGSQVYRNPFAVAREVLDQAIPL